MVDDDVVFRRGLVRKLVLDCGFKDVVELKSLLKKRFDVEADFDVLFDDLKSVDVFDEDGVSVFNVKLLANCNAHLERLNFISKNAKYDNQRIKAITSFFKCAQDFQVLLKSIYGGGKSSSGSGSGGGEAVVFE